MLVILVEIRKFALRNLFLPRPYFLRVKWFTDSDPQTGRSNFLQYVAYPWYIKPSFSTRWGWKAWLLRMVGGTIPGDEQCYPAGYRICDLGPITLVGEGEEEMNKTRRELTAKRAACAFSR